MVVVQSIPSLRPGQSPDTRPRQCMHVAFQCLEGNCLATHFQKSTVPVVSLLLLHLILCQRYPHSPLAAPCESRKASWRNQVSSLKPRQGISYPLLLGGDLHCAPPMYINQQCVSGPVLPIWVMRNIYQNQCLIFFLVCSRLCKTDALSANTFSSPYHNISALFINIISAERFSFE